MSVLLMFISYILAFGKLTLHADYKIEGDNLIISSRIINPTFTRYGWSYGELCDHNLDPAIKVNNRPITILPENSDRPSCLMVTSTTQIFPLGILFLNTISIPLDNLPRDRNIIEITYGNENGTTENYSGFFVGNEEEPIIETKKISTKLEIEVKK